MKKETEELLNNYLAVERKLLRHLDTLGTGKLNDCKCKDVKETIAMPDEEDNTIYLYCLDCGGCVKP